MPNQVKGTKPQELSRVLKHLLGTNSFRIVKNRKINATYTDKKVKTQILIYLSNKEVIIRITSSDKISYLSINKILFKRFFYDSIKEQRKWQGKNIKKGRKRK